MVNLIWSNIVLNPVSASLLRLYIKNYLFYFVSTSYEIAVWEIFPTYINYLKLFSKKSKI